MSAAKLATLVLLVAMLEVRPSRGARLHLRLLRERYRAVLQ